jgi:hypothetical protein
LALGGVETGWAVNRDLTEGGECWPWKRSTVGWAARNGLICPANYRLGSHAWLRSRSTAIPLQIAHELVAPEPRPTSTKIAATTQAVGSPPNKATTCTDKLFFPHFRFSRTLCVSFIPTISITLQCTHKCCPPTCISPSFYFVKSLIHPPARPLCVHVQINKKYA